MKNNDPTSRKKFLRSSSAINFHSGFVSDPSTYYEVLEPVTKTNKPPMVLIHGGAVSGACYMVTADGQIGRAHAELQSHHDLVCRLLLEKKKI